MTSIGMSDDLGFSCMGIDHIHFYLHSIGRWGEWYQRIWGFQLKGQRITGDTESLWLSQGDIHILLSHSLRGEGPVAAYLQHHPQGIADVALRVDSVDRAYRDLTTKHQSVSWLHAQGPIRHLQFQLPGSLLEMAPAHSFDLSHSLIERPSASTHPILPGFEILNETLLAPPTSTHLSHIDHIVINVPRQSLAPLAAWYGRVFNWHALYQYRITTQHSGLNSVVLGPAPNPNPPLLIALNEPLDPASQVQEFIDANGGPGIQHVALHSTDIVTSVACLQSRDVSFLSVPETYYQTLPQHLPGCDLDLLARHQILVDQNHPHLPEQILLQIFTQPLFPEPTFFYEIIQRCAVATGFGEANFQALFEAIERQQRQRTQTTKPLNGPHSQMD